MSIIVRTIAEQAYQIVRERILIGDLPGAMPVRQDALAEELGVSKIPLREALTCLEQDGLLSSSPNKGFVVRRLSAEEADEVFGLRLKLEPDAAARASVKSDAAGQAIARKAFEAMERDPVEGDPDYVMLNRAFHTALVRPGIGLVTSQLVERLNILAERYVRMHLEPVGRHSRAALEHQQILQAWLARDAVRVEALVSEHVAGTLNDVREQLSAAGESSKTPGTAKTLGDVAVRVGSSTPSAL